ncbi:MAG: NUDIX hydrolase [Clostridia bacterium]|jgi:8-oxo-dGTP diphosphatase|nr:NUDIX hydrolase [Clostridia bacterium]MBT7122861.1 NUDIX hydrolase [Clostridia bacterium]
MPYKPSGKEETKFLENYDASKYEKPSLAADVALFAVDSGSLKLLLIERGGFPYKGYWALPGGFVDIDEDIADAAKRELNEETGIDVSYLEQAAVWGKPNRDPRQRVITVSFVALVELDSVKAKAGDDASQAEWFAITDYKKSVGETDTRVTYTLRGKTNITAEVVFPNNRIQEITAEESGGLAFDHAESIAVSVELLKRRAAEIAQFSLEKRQREQAVRVVLST